MKILKLLLIFLSLLLTQCQNYKNPSRSISTKRHNGENKEKLQVEDTDSIKFIVFLKNLKIAIKKGKSTEVKHLINFPIQTAPLWTNDDLEDFADDKNYGLIKEKDFGKYYKQVFTTGVIKNLNISNVDDISKIDPNSNEDYFKRLKLITDKNSSMFNLYLQYAQGNNNETSFGFVFGKIGGQYRVLSFYTPWRIKN